MPTIISNPIARIYATIARKFFPCPQRLADKRNQNGTVVEKRLFDAWGNIVKVQDAYGNTLAGLTILDRGYTGHEHLQSVGLIHSGPKSNLLTKIQKWGNNTSAITETNDYDSFGNITQKIISASGITDRKTSFVYDPTGLYLKESSDIEQFKTAYEYYPNGTLKSEKKQTELNSWSNAHETGYDYDSWFRKKTVTDYLGKTHTYAYLRLPTR